VVSEGSGVERGQKDKQRLFDIDRNATVIIGLLNVLLHGLNDLDSILERHLEVKQHQTHRHD